MFPFAAAVLALFTACNNAEYIPAPDNFQALIYQSYTRVSYRDSSRTCFKAEWEAGDYILIMTDTEDAMDEGNYSIAVADGPGQVVNFLCLTTEPNAPFIAYYPRDLISGFLPIEQKYRPDGPADAPMLAKSPTRYLMFKPMCGVLEFRISSESGNRTVSSIVLTTDQSQNGKFVIDGNIKAVAYGSQTTTLNCENGVEIGAEAKSFWFSVPENDYTGVSLEINFTDGTSKRMVFEKDKVLSLKRAEVLTCDINLTIASDAKVAKSVTLEPGYVFNRTVKAFAEPDKAATLEYTSADSIITAIKFVTSAMNPEGTRIDDFSTATGIYATFDEVSGVVTIATEAEKICLNQDCFGMFANLTTMKSINFEILEGSKVEDMTQMFAGCSALRKLDICNLPGTCVKRMDNCFAGCSRIEELDFSNFNTNVIYDMSSCFSHCSNLKNLNLSGFHTTNLVRMTYTFYYCTSLEKLDISTFDTCSINADSFSYCFNTTPTLTELRLGSKFLPSDGGRPSYFFTQSGQDQNERCGSMSGLNIYCSQEVANWLATTNLRWIQSGYKNKAAIPVKFIDSGTGSQINVEWSAN